MGAIQRVLEYLENKGVSKYKFYKETGLSNGFLDKGENVGSDKCEIIISCYSDLNLYWLITGKGEMLLGSQSSLDQVPDNIKELAALYRECNDKGNRIIELLEENARLKEERRQ
ncbi:hypothetical protein [uncultured Acetobacteroides sp.]|uniref:hypothetical protein n=1 Tax=uncultured Acetobacteroides sp. TaxID=1760811 RepID=UPI0029F59ED2|nr:hypothetical protein [uncultured Acetobacteroides sp.]